MSVRIFGRSNDFVIEFLTSERTHSAIKSNFITTMFEGGILLVPCLKSQEVLEKLEKGSGSEQYQFKGTPYWYILREADVALASSS